MSTLSLPEVRQMVAAAERYVAGEIHFSALVRPIEECLFWSKVYRLHPSIYQLASQWSEWVGRRWNEFGQFQVSMTEAELHSRIAADLNRFNEQK